MGSPVTFTQRLSLHHDVVRMLLVIFLICTVGEFRVPNQSEFDVTTHLSVTDIAIDSKTSPSVIQVTTKQSKNQPL